MKTVRGFFSGLLAASMACLAMGQDPVDESAPTTPAPSAETISVVIIPIRSQIDKPALYVLRRGLKEAITNEVDTVVLDMKTPGGRVDVTLDIMEALDRFPGKTITYVNNEAISAGAIIASVTDDIYFSPKATIGAAEVITGSGADVSESMKRKINSYLNAKIRSYTSETPLRADVIRSMMDPEFEFKVDDTVIKEKGELLSLTAQEAMKEYGDPARPLLGAGIATDLDDLLNQAYGKGNYTTKRLDPSWSEKLAQYLTTLTPLLFALGLLGLFIEFKTPGFGIFGVSGIILLGIVFFGYHVAGLSGYEPALVFLLGILLIAIEVFFFPGTVVLALTGIVLMLGSLIWMMLDIWPNETPQISGDLLFIPLANITAGVVGAVILFIALLKFLPSGGPWGNMVLKAAIAGEPGGIHALNASHVAGSSKNDELLGQSGVAATDMYPSGQIVIDGNRYEAKLSMGSADAGAQVRVVRASEFGLVVEVIS